MPVVSRADRRIPWSRNVCSWNGLKDRFLSKVSKTTTNYAWERVNAHLFLWNQGHSVFAVILTAYYSLESKLMDTRWSSHRDGYRIGDCRLKSKAYKICSSSYCTFWKHICMSLYVPSRFAICSSLDSQAICSKTKAFVIMVRPTLMTSLTLLVRLLEVFFAKVWTAKRANEVFCSFVRSFRTLHNTGTNATAPLSRDLRNLSRFPVQLKPKGAFWWTYQMLTPRMNVPSWYHEDNRSNILRGERLGMTEAWLYPCVLDRAAAVAPKAPATNTWKNWDTARKKLWAFWTSQLSQVEGATSVAQGFGRAGRKCCKGLPLSFPFKEQEQFIFISTQNMFAGSPESNLVPSSDSSSF